MENGETEEETALREVFEETNVKIKLINGFKKTNEYSLPKKNDTIKKVIYFLGMFQNQKIVCQNEELSGAHLLSYTEAMSMLQFESLKRILEETDEYIRNNTIK